MSLPTVPKDAYEAWKDNEVTKRFMEDVAANLRDATEERIVGTHEQIIKQAHARNEAMTILQSVLEWKPVELEEEE